jgi:DNA polymerase III subunit gamma/tau
VALIARAADGSVRDGLSLLDQAIALGGGSIGEGAVRDMLGVADRGLVFDVLEAVLKGDAPDALRRMAALYEGGADPIMVLQDLLELVHFLTRLKIVPAAGEEDPALDGDRARGLAVAQKLGTPVLARAWQMLLKGITEAQTAPSPLQAAEMVLVRLAYVADLPAPADLVKQLSSGRDPSGASAPTPRVTTSSTAAPAPVGSNGGGPRMGMSSDGGAAPRLAVREESEAAPALPQPQSFLEVIELFDKHREALLRSHLHGHVHIVHFEPGRIEFRPALGAPRDLANKLGKLLGEWTGTRWVVSISSEEGAPTLREEAEARDLSLRNEAAQHPLVRAVLEAFPGARIEAVRELGAAEPAAEAEPADSAEERSEGDDFR